MRNILSDLVLTLNMFQMDSDSVAGSGLLLELPCFFRTPVEWQSGDTWREWVRLECILYFAVCALAFFVTEQLRTAILS
jgi:hypothetical protein